MASIFFQQSKRRIRLGDESNELWRKGFDFVEFKEEGKERSIVVCAFKFKDYQTPKERGPGPLMATDDP